MGCSFKPGLEENRHHGEKKKGQGGGVRKSLARRNFRRNVLKKRPKKIKEHRGSSRGGRTDRGKEKFNGKIERGGEMRKKKRDSAKKEGRKRGEKSRANGGREFVAIKEKDLRGATPGQKKPGGRKSGERGYSSWENWKANGPQTQAGGDSIPSPGGDWPCRVKRSCTVKNTRNLQGGEKKKINE